MAQISRIGLVFCPFGAYFASIFLGRIYLGLWHLFGRFMSMFGLGTFITDFTLGIVYLICAGIWILPFIALGGKHPNLVLFSYFMSWSCFILGMPFLIPAWYNATWVF